MSSVDPPGTYDADVAELRSRILADAPAPAIDEADIARLEQVSREAMTRGRVIPRATELRIRLSGVGVDGNAIPVHTAAQVLDAVQGAVSSIGAAIKLQKRGKAPKQVDKPGRIGVRKATELRLNANVSAGSVVFHLEGFREVESTDPQLSPDGSDTLVDQALRELFRILEAAETDSAGSIGALTTQMRSLGAMVAAKLNRLAEETTTEKIDLDLGHWSPSGGRSNVEFKQRGAAAVREAAERNRVTVIPRTVDGVLHTVTDGQDLCRLTTDEGEKLRLAVEPDVGVTLGSLLGKRVTAEIATTVKWKLASGREFKTHQLLSADETDDDAV